jgi:hypothetical protein
VITACTVVVPARAWARLADGAAVARALPGGVRGSTRADGTVEVVVDVALGAATGRLSATATALAAGAARIVAEGEPGGVDAVVRVDPASGTIIVESTVTGPLGTVGSGLLAAWITRTATALLAGLAQSPSVAAPVEPAPATADDEVAVAPAAPVVSPAASIPRDLIGPAPGARSPVSAARAAVALAGALAVGYLAGRRRRS